MAVAAYASLNSLMQVLDNIQDRAPSGLVQVDMDQIGTLEEQVSFLLQFLETYSLENTEYREDLARQMADVAIEAEDIIDLHVVDQLRVRFGYLSFSTSFFQTIREVIEKMDSIKKELMTEECLIQGLQKLKVSVSSKVPVSNKGVDKKNTMVGFDGHLNRIKEELAGPRSSLQIISIVGMGGIGKTTLARHVFDDPYVVHHFLKLHWVTLSQQYSVREILLSLLNDGTSKESSEDVAELGLRLYQNLSGRKYLIVMDDVWSTEAWDELRRFFPDDNNGSRAMLTTRLLNVAILLGSHPYSMDFLDEDKSWVLFCEKAFPQRNCPPELKETGMKIAKSCRGLPLAIVVICGLLANCEMTKEHWEFVAQNVNSFVNSENDEHCLKILGLSYKHLPIHLKPCLLYMGVFPEDKEVQVSELIKLWVAEGFVKPIGAKSLEEVAQGYLNDLIGRNLILNRKRSHTGKVKRCGVHDLIRDLCIKESKKEQLFSVPRVLKQYGYDIINREKRCFLCCHSNQVEGIRFCEVFLGSRFTSFVSLWVCKSCTNRYPRLYKSRLITAGTTFNDNYEIFRQPTQLRYYTSVTWTCSIALLWNLQTLCINGFKNDPPVLPSEIWEMPQLRLLLVKQYTILPDFVAEKERKGFPILKNLHTLSRIKNFRCTREVVGRMPNLKKLDIIYPDDVFELNLMHNLESLALSSHCFPLKKISFPNSLKKLSLWWCEIPWEDMTIIGKLPNLQVLKLKSDAFEGREWNPVAGDFPQLKLLMIQFHYKWERWGAEKEHFPVLETLLLWDIKKLEEIPLSIGDIDTLNSIHLFNCSNRINNSGKAILEEQRSMGNEGLQLHITSYFNIEEDDLETVWLSNKLLKTSLIRG